MIRNNNLFVTLSSSLVSESGNNINGAAIMVTCSGGDSHVHVSDAAAVEGKQILSAIIIPLIISYGSSQP